MSMATGSTTVLRTCASYARTVTRRRRRGAGGVDRRLALGLPSAPGGTGRRATLRKLCLRTWGFESPGAHRGTDRSVQDLPHGRRQDRRLEGADPAVIMTLRRRTR